MFIEKIPLENSKHAELTVYLHEVSPEMPGRKQRPAILIFPGGGYGFVSDRENQPVAEVFFAKGYQVFVLKYSINEDARNMQPLMEAAQSVALIRANALKWNVKADQIAVCGFSAGGHLAGSVGILSGRKELLDRLLMTQQQCRPNAMILCYPVITSGEFAHRGSFTQLTGYDHDEEHNQAYSLENFVDDFTPPAFIWHTVDDGCVPVENSLLLMTQLQKHKIPFEAHLFDHGPHGLSLCNEEVGTPAPHCAHWVELCAEWLGRLFDFKE